VTRIDQNDVAAFFRDLLCSLAFSKVFFIPLMCFDQLGLHAIPRFIHPPTELRLSLSLLITDSLCAFLLRTLDRERTTFSLEGLVLLDTNVRDAHQRNSCNCISIINFLYYKYRRLPVVLSIQSSKGFLQVTRHCGPSVERTSSVAAAALSLSSPLLPAFPGSAADREWRVPGRTRVRSLAAIPTVRQ